MELGERCPANSEPLQVIFLIKELLELPYLLAVTFMSSPEMSLKMEIPLNA